MIKLAAAILVVLAITLPANASTNCDQRYLHTCWGEWFPATGKQATHQHRRVFQTRHQSRAGRRVNNREPRVRSDPPRASIVTVQTAAGVPITVASAVAGKFTGFIGDLVARGIKPSTIHCYAHGGHVRGSLHYSGRACDFNGSASRWSAMNNGRVADLASKWGLRDGCSFTIRGGRRDCGHIDTGSVSVASRHGRVRVANR